MTAVSLLLAPMEAVAKYSSRGAAAGSSAGAEPAPEGAGESLSAFEQQFRAGQALDDMGEPLGAARAWRTAASMLPESAEQRDNRAALHGFIAEAYEKSLASSPDVAVLTEAVGVLDEYAASFAAAHPDRRLPDEVAAARGRLKERLQRLQPPRPPDTPAPAKQWRGLAIGGGIAVGGGVAMLMMLVAGAARAGTLTNQFNDDSKQCDKDALTPHCEGILDAGYRAERMQIAGGILAPALISVGAGLLVVAMRRKRASAHAWTPMLGRTVLGASWQIRF